MELLIAGWELRDINIVAGCFVYGGIGLLVTCLILRLTWLK
jgi:hypothetical protein